MKLMNFGKLQNTGNKKTAHDTQTYNAGYNIDTSVCELYTDSFQIF